jgi:hypothetical protein
VARIPKAIRKMRMDIRPGEPKILLAASCMAREAPGWELVAPMSDLRGISRSHATADEGREAKGIFGWRTAPLWNRTVTLNGPCP